MSEHYNLEKKSTVRLVLRFPGEKHYDNHTPLQRHKNNHLFPFPVRARAEKWAHSSKNNRLFCSLVLFSVVALLATITNPALKSFDVENTRTKRKARRKIVVQDIPALAINGRLSAVVLTYKNHAKFQRLLESILNQKGGTLELIIADTGCVPDTVKIVDRLLNQSQNSWLSHKYMRLCDNPGYALGNNQAVKLVDSSSKWILFLNDDIVMQGDNFASSMLELGEAKGEVAAAVGCTLRTIDGTKVLEAGSIIWSDGNAAGYGRDREDLNSSDLVYPRPIDYVSGACLMIRKNVFEDYGGFDGRRFPNYYEDTDIQMHIQHNLKKQVWLQPKAVALHDEHASFGNTTSVMKMQQASEIFKQKWEAFLPQHVSNPFLEHTCGKTVPFLMASDTRARDPTKVRILYIDGQLPNRFKGSGFGRAFDNLSMMAELGHRITVASIDATAHEYCFEPAPVLDETADEWCDEPVASMDVTTDEFCDETTIASIDAAAEAWCNAACRDEIRQLGVELVLTSWKALFEERLGFYEVVIVSRPTTFLAVHSKLREHFQESPFGLVYDCEALWYRRDEEMVSLLEGGIEFPSFGADMNLSATKLEINSAKVNETKLMTMADIVLSVSEKETKTISDMFPDLMTYSIGHVMDLDKWTRQIHGYNERNGILFIAAFHGLMYYNGDAIWYFLKEIYPLVLSELAMPIPLTIAGSKIPEYLISFVERAGFMDYVTFIESPIDLVPLFDSHRIFIAPHMYGSGIQYKISEALSHGIPCVASELSARGFGLTPNDDVMCIGETPEMFMKCIVLINGSAKKWNQLSKGGQAFIRKTHNRATVTQRLSDVIAVAKTKHDEMKAIHNIQPKAFISHRLFSTTL